MVGSVPSKYNLKILWRKNEPFYFVENMALIFNVMHVQAISLSVLNYGDVEAAACILTLSIRFSAVLFVNSGLD